MNFKTKNFNKMKLYETLENQLKKEPNYVTDSGELKKWVVINKAQNYDAELIGLLLDDKELKAKSTQIVIKEIRFGPQTDEHDYEFKKKNAIKFLQDGAKLKAFVFFKGRSIIYKEQGQILLLRLAQELEEFGKVEAMPVLEGKRMIMYIAPKKKK